MTDISKALEGIVSAISNLSRRVRDLEVRPKFSSSELYVEGDIYTTPFTNYFAGATIIGWDSFSSADLYYKRVGNTVYMEILLEGESNDTVASFSLPYTPYSKVWSGPIAAISGGSAIAGAIYQISAGASIVDLYTSASGAAWVATGTKSVRFQFRYEAA